jgi:RNA polymerase primary sigma factor
MIRVIDRSFQIFLSDITKHRILTKAEERELIRRTQAGDERACRFLCDCNLKFVLQVAMKFRGNGLEVDELVKEGNYGLHKAAHSFDLACQLRFLSYAVWWVRAKMLRAIDEQGRILRISPFQARALAKLRAMPLEQFIGGDFLHPDANLEKPRGRGPKPPAYMREALNAVTPHSIDTPINDGGDTYASFLASPTPSPEEAAVKAENKGIARELLATLEPRDRRIVRLLFGLESGEAMTLDQVAGIFDLSKERVRQIRNDAMRQMRKRAGKYGG